MHDFSARAWFSTGVKLPIILSFTEMSQPIMAAIPQVFGNITKGYPMKYLPPMVLVLITISMLCFTGLAQARNTLHKLNVNEALEIGRDKGVLLDNVRVFFAGQRHPKVLKKYGEFRTNKKTNAFNKSDERACQWAFFSAIKSLQSRALKEGGNAVINIKSHYKSREFSSPTQFECGAGALIAGVALKGTVVKMK